MVVVQFVHSFPHPLENEFYADWKAPSHYWVLSRSSACPVTFIFMSEQSAMIMGALKTRNSSKGMLSCWMCKYRGTSGELLVSIMVVDYRSLNKITKKIKYPLPLIEDHIDQLRNKSIFTSLDLKSGFHQIPMHPDSIEKTAFVTPDGQWAYLKLPCGLPNAPAVFQRTMSKIFKGIALVYIDDILLATSTADEMCKVLEKVMAILRDNGVTLNLKKYRFFQNEIEYLGREIWVNAVRPGTHKIDAVLKAPDQQDVKDIRQFLGLTNYFRKFIKNYALIVAPVTNQLRKNTPWVWGSAQKTAAAKIKSILAE